jgi:integrase/ribosomal protein L40E
MSAIINKIEHVLNSEKLTDEQKATLTLFDKFNDLERNASLSTRLGYLVTAYKLGMANKKPFEQMEKQDLENFLSIDKAVEKPSTFELRKEHLKRFFRWLNWHLVGEDGKLRNFPMPKVVNWIEVKIVDTNIQFEDLPTEEEILKIATHTETQRDRALILTLWETGAEPIAILNLKVGDVVFNQYGAIVSFKPQSGKLKTPFRYRQIPVRTAANDIRLWLSMHPKKDDAKSPLWWTDRKNHALGYARLRTIFVKATKRAEISKTYNLYKLRHQRLTEVADVLNVEELKKFAGHSKYSNVTPRYIHLNERAIQDKIYRERGAELQEVKKKEPVLTVKVCPRCKHENSPTATFCEQCSMPLDLKTAIEVQAKADILQHGSEFADPTNEKFAELMKLVSQLPAEVTQKIQNEMYARIAIEMLKITKS